MKRFASAIMLLLSLPWPMAQAADPPSITGPELAVLSRALSFLQPPSQGEGRLTIVYAAGNPGSRRDAEAIATMIGERLAFGGGAQHPLLAEAGSLATTAANGSVFIVAAGANGPAVMAASQARHALCVTAEISAVRAGTCMMAILTQPRPDIVVNHDAVAQAGLSFKTAFRMMISEI